ncbi:MAG: 7-cyano-7-deazaguanine synthase QueC [Thermoplasmata archaeon]|nr:MAG: 7-cyano-7-deazaguanine synthase QueC [Thermoplasmata archaeon]
MKKAVVLLSGGIDSSTTLAIALDMGYECHGLTFRYGQRHEKEVKCAEKIAKHYGIMHRVVNLDLSWMGGSALFSGEIPERRAKDIRKILSGRIPSTYVPARNTVLIAISAGYAEVIGAEAIFIGANAIDYSGYPDCRPEYLNAMEKAINLGTKVGIEGGGIKIIAPLLTMTKAEIIRKGAELGVPYDLTWSCYRGGDKACGRCDSCILRLKGFKEAGIKDPIAYEFVPEEFKDAVAEGV